MATKIRRRLRDSTDAIIDRLLMRAADGEPISFIELCALAGLDPARDFIGASLAGRNFRSADLRGFDFSHADLTNADFSGANISGVSFQEAIQIGTKFEGAIRHLPLGAVKQ